MSNYLYIFFLFFILVLFLKSNLIGNKLRVLSEPDSIRKFQERPVPQVGGIIFFLVIISLAIIDSKIILLSLKELVPSVGINIFFFFISFFLLFFVGFIDDRKNLDPKNKLVFLIFIAYILSSAISLNDKIYIRLSFYKNIDLFGFHNLVLIFFFVFLINVLNMFDGLNLQSSIIFLTVNIYIIFYLGFEPLIAIIIIFLLIFSFFNYKNQAYLGDCGIYLLTFTTFNFLLKIYKNEVFKVSLDEFFILLILPICDCVRVILSRLNQKSSPFLGDRKHFHHLILNKFSYNFSVFVIAIGTLMPIVLYKIFNLGFFVSLLFFIFYYFLSLNIKGLKSE